MMNNSAVGIRGGCRGAALENVLAAGFPPFLFTLSFFFFHAEEQLNVGTAAGLDEFVLIMVKRRENEEDLENHFPRSRI